MSRPKLAVLATEFSPHSHADVAFKPLVLGYPWKNGFAEPQTEVVSLYLDQHPDNDVGVAFAQDHDIPVFDTVGEALSLGRPGVNVDGVVIIGEHGDYPLNLRGQVMYPRRRLFDASIAAMVVAQRFVPIYLDKHFSWSFQDARYMFDTAARLGIPMLAGSTAPLMWRVPTVDWPYGAPMSKSIAIGYGPPEVYEFHSLEVHQCIVERRQGWETGVRAVQDLVRGSYWGVEAHEPSSKALLGAALESAGVTGDWAYDARGLLRQVIRIDYVDGLTSHILRFDRLVNARAVAAMGENGIVATSFRGELSPPWRHFSFLVRQMERLFTTESTPYPVERTLLTTGILEAAMRSRAAGGPRIETPQLSTIQYTPLEVIPDTGANEMPPFQLAKDINVDT